MAVIHLLVGRSGKYFLLFNAANFYQDGSIVRYLSLRDAFTAARWLNASGSESLYNSAGDWTLILMYWHEGWNITSSELWMPLSAIRRWTARHGSSQHIWATPVTLTAFLHPRVPQCLSIFHISVSWAQTREGKKGGGGAGRRKDDDSTG